MSLLSFSSLIGIQMLIKSIVKYEREALLLKKKLLPDLDLKTEYKKNNSYISSSFYLRKYTLKIGI